jgi:hypothetical protein
MGPRRLDFKGLPIDLAEQLRLARVTDHAVLRFLERGADYPVPALRRRILSEPVLHGMALGAARVIHEGLIYRLEGNSVVTILKAGD